MLIIGGVITLLIKLPELMGYISEQEQIPKAIRFLLNALVTIVFIGLLFSFALVACNV